MLVILESPTVRERVAQSMELLRQQRGWSQAEVARRTHRTRAWVSAFLKTGSKAGMPLKGLDGIAEAFGVDVSLLLQPDRIKAGMTGSDIRSVVNTAITPSSPRESLHGVQLADTVNQLQSESDRLTATLFDIHIAISKHFEGVSGNNRAPGRVAAATRKTARTGRQHRRTRS